MRDATRIMKRHPKNPLITTDMLPGVASVMNPSPVMYKGKTILIVSAFTYKWPDNAVGGWIAESENGVDFKVRTDKPFIDLTEAGHPFDKLKCTIIDNRVTQIGNTYYIMTPVFQEGEGPFCLLGKTTDFETYIPIEIVSLPENRVPSLFPEKINGKYYRLDRPSGGQGGGASIWLSTSPDLVHWGCCRQLLKPGYAIWNVKKIGPTPPIKTPQGWLEIVHGVWSWTSGDNHYHIGAVLLDLEDPTKIIGKTYSWLLAPEESYEINGTVDNVCFPCGALADIQKDELRIYYGAADTRICLATGSLSDVIEACKREI